MPKMVLAPIAIFSFNRPEHLKKTIEALAANSLAKDSPLYIFSDAARSEKDIPLVNEVRKIINTVQGFSEVHAILRDANLGLADSISSGVTMLMEKFGKAVILEDDIVTSPYFLEYMNTALELYKDNERVMHISGFMPPINTQGLPETFFLSQASCWGWATWASRWKFFERNPSALIDEFDQKKIRKFNMEEGYNPRRDLPVDISPTSPERESGSRRLRGAQSP
jgi:GT2 family glycosyltransferase